MVKTCFCLGIKHRFLRVFLFLVANLLMTSSSYGLTLLIDKGERTLKVLENQKIQKVYPVGLGLESLLPKEKRGDFLTPEGLYKITEIRPSKSFGYFIEINYPNLNDLGWAYYKGFISKEQFAVYLEIFLANAKLEQTPLGSKIGIHGGGAYKIEKGKRNYSWTQGCIALEDRDLRDLLNSISEGQKVIILNSQKPLYEMLKKLVYPVRIKPLDFWEGELYLKLNDYLFLTFTLRETYKGARYLEIKKWVQGELKEQMMSDEFGKVNQEDQLKNILLENLENLLNPYKNLEF
ncbi:L,D-transpeptidase family protein [Thermodesulfobacterium hveragerdense]|uniref:L,D-transpeptidase family protein n=1 Tax=Thermodesulfobacterium hveragerdense TaxID=53424 RepID=UPI0004287B56|nr:L,D-transpeptidase [Thermodesulfobacterium hveragerdense]